MPASDDPSHWNDALAEGLKKRAASAGTNVASRSTSSRRMKLSGNTIDRLLAEVAVEFAQRKATAQRQNLTAPARVYANFRNDPARFGREILGENFTPDIISVMESVRDNPVTVARSANATGKTHGAARIAVWFYKVFPGAQVYTTAAPPEDNLKRLLWGEIGKVAVKNPDLFSGDRVNSMHIARSPFEFITGVAIPTNTSSTEQEARFSGKHAPYLLFVVDEGDAVPQGIYNAIKGCMAGGHARMLIMFNPRSRSNVLARMEREGSANVVELSAFKHPNIVLGQEIYPGAVTRETTLRRINQMTRPLTQYEQPDARCYQVPDFLVGLVGHSDAGEPFPPLVGGWRRIEDPIFSYMVLGQYPAQASNQLISEEWIDNARARYDAYKVIHGEKPPADIKAIAGVDIAEFGIDSNVMFLRYGGWIHPAFTWGDMDVIASADRIISILEGYMPNVRAINIDAIGVGAGVAPAIRQKFNRDVFPNGVKSSEKPTEKPVGIGGEIMGTFGTLRDQMWWAVREWLRKDPGAMLPPDERLREELLVATYENIPNKGVKVMDKARMKELLARSPDRADALCLCFAPLRGFMASGVNYGTGKVSTLLRT